MLHLDKLGNLERRKKTEIKELDTRLEESTKQLEVIRSDIDTKLAQYEADRRSAIDNDLAEKQELLNVVNNNCEELKEQVDNKRDELNSINESIAKIKKQNELTVAEDTKRIKDLKLEIDKLEAETEEARSELAKLYREKAQVSGDTRRAEERHRKFIEYEQKARKELETKNTALQRLQEELAQEKRFIKARRSILPEM